MALLLQSSRSYRELKTTSPGSSVTVSTQQRMCPRQTAIKVSSLAACPTSHPVQNSGHHAQGPVDFSSAVHRRTPTTPSDDAVSAVHRVSVPWTHIETAKWAFCVAAPNVWNSLPNDIRNASSLSSFRAELKTHYFYCVDIPTAVPLYWLLVNIMALYKSLLLTVHNICSRCWMNF